MAPSGMVGIIVLNYNGRNCLTACLASLGRLLYQPFFVVVVDNHSSDGSLEEAKKAFPDYEYVEQATNTGFASGMNVGIKRALARGAEAVWLFNNDAEADPRSLQALWQAHLRHPEAGALSPVILDPQGKEWFAKGRINYARMRVEHTEPTGSERSREAYASEFLTGCALFLTREALERVGLLDEGFFLYYEDADYSVRVRRFGLALLVVPGAVVSHRERSGLSPEKLYHLVYSGLLFFRRQAPWYWRPYLSVYATMRRIKNAFDRLLGRESAVLVHRAYARFFSRV